MSAFKNSFLLLFFIVLAILLGLRDNCCVDFYVYRDLISAALKLESCSPFWFKDPGLCILTLGACNITQEPKGFFIIFYLLSFAPLFWIFISKRTPPLSQFRFVWAFFAMTLFPYAMNGLRQFVAMCFFMAFITYAYLGRTFFAGPLVATAFHLTSIIPMSLVGLSNFLGQRVKKSILILFGLIALGVFSYFQEHLLFLNQVQESYASKLENQWLEPIGMMEYLKLAFPIILVFIAKFLVKSEKESETSKGLTFILTSMILLSCVVILIFKDNKMYFLRFNYFNRLFEVLFASLTIRNSGILFLQILTLLYISTYLISDILSYHSGVLS